MNKKSYFNFLAFRAGLYDTELSVNARLIYTHLVQYSSDRGNCVLFEITEPQIASKLGMTTSSGGLAVKTVQRALKELEDRNYIKKWQKYKGTGVPLTIQMNFENEFLKAKQDNNKQKLMTNLDNEEQPSDQKPSPIVQPILSIPIHNYPVQSCNYPEQSDNYPVQSCTIGDGTEEKVDVEKAKEYIDQELDAVQNFANLSAVGTTLRNYVRDDCKIPGLEEYLNLKIKEKAEDIRNSKENDVRLCEASLPSR